MAKCYVCLFDDKMPVADRAAYVCRQCASAHGLQPGAHVERRELMASQFVKELEKATPNPKNWGSYRLQWRCDVPWDRR